MHYRDFDGLFRWQLGVGVTVDTQAYENVVGQPWTGPSYMTKEEGAEAFNQTVGQFGLAPLKDPKGYMTLDDNIYDGVKAVFADVYETTLDRIEQGFMTGTTYAVQAVINKMDAVVRDAMKDAYPDDLKYTDLRHIPMTDEVDQKAEGLAECRRNMTLIRSIKRSFEADALEKEHAKLVEQKANLKTAITHAYQQSQPTSLSMEDLNHYQGLEV